MEKEHLRNDTECENCGYTVDRVYCSKCGQKNDVTRQSFGHLVTHFAEDLTHYDSSFWKTIKYLLFRPSMLTTEYLSGKRKLYVPPVKLYIFISFLTFFLMAILPDFSEKKEKHNDVATETHETSTPQAIKLNEKEDIYLFSLSDTLGGSLYNPIRYKSVKEMDSIEQLKPEAFRLSSFERARAKKLIRLYQNNTPQQVAQKFYSSIPHNISKAIFLYMPIFAFWLWLFHGKKRWYFFDHGIFTLHYFSFLLLGIAFITILQSIFSIFSDGENETSIAIFSTISIFIFLWQMFYFYRSHRKMYGEDIVVNFIKSTVLFAINMFFILLTAYGLMIYTLHNLH